MSSRPYLRFSIITPSYNHADYIEQTIRSVVEQNYPYIEYIVMDGGSTDETLNVLRRFEGRLQWLSQSDKGQADAINKGFALATGDILGWLNSDDYYAPGALHAVAEFFTMSLDALFVYGNAVGIDRKGRKYGVRHHINARQKIAESDFDVLVNRYDFLVQPACFWRVSLWRDIGELDVSLRYAMDYEYWMRAARVTHFHYLPKTLAFERLYGEAKTGTGGIARIEEIEHIARRYGGAGLPYDYRPEAVAHYLTNALKCGFKGQFAKARQYFTRATAQKAPLGKGLRHTAIFILLGQRLVPIAWLWLNRFRTMRQPHSKWRQPIFDESASK